LPLLSWAVSKRPPLEPGTRRLPIAVEDHDIEYGSFGGTIPEGEYGAGKVEIWDRGDFVLKEREANKIRLELRGSKLSGTTSLFI